MTAFEMYRCPETGAPLEFVSTDGTEQNGELRTADGRTYPVTDGIPRLLTRATMRRVSEVAASRTAGGEGLDIVRIRGHRSRLQPARDYIFQVWFGEDYDERIPQLFRGYHPSLIVERILALGTLGAITVLAALTTRQRPVQALIVAVGLALMVLSGRWSAWVRKLQPYPNPSGLGGHRAYDLFEKNNQITVEEAIRDRSRPGTTLRVLDTFSGTGNALVYARDSLPGGRDAPSLEMFATDYVLGMLRRARTKVSAAFSQSDCHALPFADDSFDIVMAIGGIQAADDVRKAIAELNRVAKPGGLVLINHWQLHRGATPFEQVWYRLIACRLYAVCEAPVNELPPLIKNLRVSQLGPFFFTMSFEKVAG